MKRGRTVTRAVTAIAAGAAVLIGVAGTAPAAPKAVASGQSAVRPTISDWQFVSAGTAPPSQAACNAITPLARRCFDPVAMANSYDYAGLTNRGAGKTIALVDSFGSSTIASDLNNFDTQFSLQHMCGETGVTCSSGMPTFSILNVQGSPPPNPPPASNGTGQENHSAWALEVSLDVEWAHATAPMANVLLVTTPTAETLGVQGLVQMMNAEQYVVDHHLADVISQSFAAGEASFSSFVSLQNLRHAFISAQANHVTVFGSSGDGGTTNGVKEPVKNAAVIPYPSVVWPASDPLVTGVGGTNLCTNAVTGTSIDTVSPPLACQSARNPTGDRETAWVDAGGGYSIYFPRPAFQDTLPPGSSYVGSSVGAPGPNSNMRGVPDIAYQASQRTGVLVYMTEASTKGGSAGCTATVPCSPGWYVVGGTSSSSPQWAGLIAIADQVAGRDLGYINPSLYAVANNPSEYANDFYDVTHGNNQTSSIPGYSASAGWDAVTGLGTPDAAHLIPDLITATP
ncbi:MAG TPA: S53 family peptidase [Candidatus Dormibacteraeota bacterium]|nr:S53 family peptidase [Candidatus Dormibacteraeota bacterium]